jgi:hypothetical protein
MVKYHSEFGIGLLLVALNIKLGMPEGDYKGLVRLTTGFGRDAEPCVSPLTD